LPVSLATRRGLIFDQSFMAIEAAVEGLGVALGRTRFVEADIAAGRLVVPFNVVLPADAGFYIVTPEATADDPKIALFRQWLIDSVEPGGVAPPPPA
jgi:LysR family glycine cleavage system transcriptional activator